MLVICLGASVLSALIWNLWTRSFWAASIGATLTASLLTWLLTMSHFGFMDEVFLKDLGLTLGLSAIPALLISGVRRVVRLRPAR